MTFRLWRCFPTKFWQCLIQHSLCWYFCPVWPNFKLWIYHTSAFLKLIAYYHRFYCCPGVANPHQSVAWQLPFTDGVICVVAHIRITHQLCGGNNDKNQVCFCSVLDHPHCSTVLNPHLVSRVFSNSKCSPDLAHPQRSQFELLPISCLSPELSNYVVAQVSFNSWCCSALVYHQWYQLVMLPTPASPLDTYIVAQVLSN